MGFFVILKYVETRTDYWIILLIAKRIDSIGKTADKRIMKIIKFYNVPNCVPQINGRGEATGS